MANFKALKKIAALVTAIALVVCFAVSASAINVVTTTTYVTGDESLVTVDVAVTDLADGDEYVTYYATDDDGDPVHIDQAAKTGTTATFQFRTEATNLNSSVLIGRTSADATEEEITGRTITWSVDGGTTNTETIATEAENFVIKNYAPASGKEFDCVKLNNVEVDTEPASGNITVPLADFVEGQSDVIVIYEKDAESGAPTVSVNLVEKAFITVDAENAANGDNTLVEATEGNRKLTVIGRVTGTPVDADFGIIISDTEITATTMTAADFATATENKNTFKALEKNANGVFAVQLIDTSEVGSGNEFVTEGLHAAVYVKVAADEYAISAVTLN